jgi:hypothetical protein
VRDFKEDNKPIDIFNLEIEAANHGTVFSQWASEFVEATNKLNNLKEKILLNEGDIAKAIRENPEAYGWPDPSKNVTDAFINKVILSDKKHQKLKQEIVEVTYEADTCAAAKLSLDHRGRMIGHLTELFKSNYFNTNTITPEQLEQKVRKQQETLLKKSKAMKG